MTKEELFKNYSIDETHNVWNNAIDNWMSVEVYRAMHDGKLPPPGDESVLWITEFLDKVKKDPKWGFSLENFGSLYLTSKRLVYSLSDQILTAINDK